MQLRAVGFRRALTQRGLQPGTPHLWCATARVLVPQGPLCQLHNRVGKRSNATYSNLHDIARPKRVFGLRDHAGASANDRAVTDRVISDQELDQLLEGAADL